MTTWPRNTIGFLEAAVDDPAHLADWGDGRIIGLVAAICRGDLVLNLVASLQQNGTTSLRVEPSGEAG